MNVFPPPTPGKLLLLLGLCCAVVLFVLLCCWVVELWLLIGRTATPRGGIKGEVGTPSGLEKGWGLFSRSLQGWITPPQKNSGDLGLIKNLCPRHPTSFRQFQCNSHTLRGQRGPKAQQRRGEIHERQGHCRASHNSKNK